jgi:hypothetical protein
MAHPYHHATASVKKRGGDVSDYLPLHTWFDQSKSVAADFRHRALRNHAERIFMLETVFGPTITLSTGRVIPTRWGGEQHVQQDLGFIPSFADWMRAIRPLPGWGAAPGLRTVPDRRRPGLLGRPRAGRWPVPLSQPLKARHYAAAMQSLTQLRRSRSADAARSAPIPGRAGRLRAVGAIG